MGSWQPHTRENYYQLEIWQNKWSSCHHFCREGQLGQQRELVCCDVKAVPIFGQFSAQLDGNHSSPDFSEKCYHFSVAQTFNLPSINGDDFVSYRNKKKSKFKVFFPPSHWTPIDESFEPIIKWTVHREKKKRKKGLVRRLPIVIMCVPR